MNIADAVQKIGITCAGALVIGAGSMLIHTDADTRENAADIQRIDKAIGSLTSRLDSIDDHLNQLNTKMAAANQKLDDMSDGIPARKGRP